MRRTVCIVSPGHLASNPRVVKEANALHEAGYGVTVVAGDLTGFVRPFDEEILRQARWKAVRVGAGSRLQRLASRAGRSAVRAVGLPAPRLPVPLAALAHSSQTPALARAASNVSAALYIAHYVSALPAAAAAARRHGAALGFDAEDFHAGEADNQLGLVRAIEGELVPRCSHLTAASPLISEAYERLYRRKPATVLNVFPLPARPEPVRPRHPGDVLRAYWFSQSVGLDRGLQSFIKAMALTRSRVTLHIRGSDEGGHGKALIDLARRLRVGDRVELLPMASPFEMVELAGKYDIGLSLETDVSESRRLCLTNKIFTYLVASRPVMMSDTPAQKALAADLGEAAAVVSLSDPASIAAKLDRWALSPQALQAACETACRLGRTRYNWEIEQGVFLASVERALRGHGGEGCRP